jgi:hypothetical protein
MFSGTPSRSRSGSEHGAEFLLLDRSLAVLADAAARCQSLEEFHRLVSL